MEINSPLVADQKAIELTRIPVKDIIKNYKDKFGLDVSNYFIGMDFISIYKCNYTNFKFYNPASTAGDDLFYKDLASANSHYYNKWKWEYDAILPLIKPGMKVLELGSGNGHFLEKLRDLRAEGTGLEINKEAISYSLKKGLNVVNELVSEHAEKNSESYDIVCSFQVVEHIPDVKDFIKNSIKCLKKGGKLIIGVPNNNSEIFKNDLMHTLNLPPHHIGLWEETSLRSLPKVFPDITVHSILIEQPTQRHASEYYKLLLRKKISSLTPLVYLFTRKIIVTLVPVNKIINEGTTIVGVFTKI